MILDTLMKISSKIYNRDCNPYSLKSNFILQENISDLVVSGGVAANEFLRCSLADAMPSNVKLHFPDLKHCTDNGLMVAHAGLMKIENSEKNYNIEARARWSLEENNDAR